MNWQEYWSLWRLARRRLNSEKDYREFQTFQAKQVARYLQEKGVQLYGKLCLDLGSGIGGYGLEFVRHGARVILLDLMQPSLVNSPCMQIVGNGLAIPLQDETVDFVFCASLIEHVAEPIRLLNEIERILKCNGICYISFPPYYSPTGGHEFSPFHYLGERRALQIMRKRVRPEWVQKLYNMPAQAESFSEYFGKWGLYKMTIRRFRNLLKRVGFQCIDISTRYMPVSFARWPFLGEFLTWHVQFLLKKY